MSENQAQGGPGAAANAAGRLRAALARDGMLVMPGGCSPLYAKIAEAAGFEAFFVAGSQLSAFIYGVPDVGLIGMRDMSAHVQQIARVTSIPVLVDGDTGYGNAVGVHYAVREFIAAGAAGVQFEDQEAPKKSGTGAGRRCIPVAEAVGKIRAAVAARDAIDPGFVICARCDVIGAEGGSFDEAVERCTAYIADGGADLVWLNSPESLDQIRRACEAVPGPVLTTWAQPGPTPTIEQFADLGLKVILFPVVASLAGAAASWHVLHDLRERGTVALDEWGRWTAAHGWTRSRLGDLVGLPGIRGIEENFLPAEAQRDYSSTYGPMSR
jgi:2-methylisocitrate lyase-like PEP mutase family enzyme